MMLSNQWLWRVWLGGLILIGCEVIFWRSPADRLLLDWVRLVIGYIAIGAVTLDILARYRVRDLLGLFGTVLCVAPVIALVLTSKNTLVNLPTHLFSRVLGLHSIGVLWALGVWFGLWDRGYSLRWFGVGSLLFGMTTALWIRSADHFTNWSLSPALVDEVLLAYVLMGGLIVMGGYLARHYPLRSSGEMRLSSVEWGMMLLIFMVAILWDVVPNRQAVSGTLVLSGLGVLVVWFEHHTKSHPLLDHLFEQAPVDSSRIIRLWLMGGAGLMLGWFIPLNADASVSPIGILEIMIVIFGFSWMPLLMLWVAVRTLSRQSMRLDLE